MKLTTFTLYTFLGATIWNCVLAALGYFAHGQKDIIEKYNSELAIVLLVLGVLFIGYMIWNAVKPRKPNLDVTGSAPQTTTSDEKSADQK